MCLKLQLATIFLVSESGVDDQQNGFHLFPILLHVMYVCVGVLQGKSANQNQEHFITWNTNFRYFFHCSSSLYLTEVLSLCLTGYRRMYTLFNKNQAA